MSREIFVTEALTNLGAKLGVPELALDDTSRASFVYEGGHFTIQHDTEPVEMLHLYVDLGEVDGESPELLCGLLRLGFLTWAGNCMTIGLDDEGDRGIGYAGIPVVYLTPERLCDLVQRMLVSAATIRDRVERRQFEFALS